MTDALGPLTFNADTVRGLQERSADRAFQRELEHLQGHICVAAKKGDLVFQKRMSDYISRYKIIEEMKSLGFGIEITGDAPGDVFVTFRW
jgi:hypothetical protein